MGSLNDMEFAVMPSGKHDESLYEQVTERFGLDRSKIENILPCTPFQRDVMDSAAADGRQALGHAIFKLPKHVDVQRLAAAWKEIVRRTPSLRACIFKAATGDCFQVVMRESPFSWMSWTCVDKEEVVQDEAAVAATGPRCNRYAVLEDPSIKQRLLIWTFSHALVDKALQIRILRQVVMAYEGREVQCPKRPAGLVDSHTENTEPAIRFWKKHLNGLDAFVYPPLPSHVNGPRPHAKAECHISYPSATRYKWPKTIVCRTALAVLISRYINSAEVLFGVVVDGSQGLEDEGPSRTVVPIRVLCDKDRSVPDIMEDITIHDHATREFSQLGLCEIRRTGAGGPATCGFQTVLLVSDGDSSRAPEWEIHGNVEESDHLFVPCTNRALLIDCQIVEDSALLMARYDQNVIDARQMDRFLQQLGHLIQQLQNCAVDPPLVGRLDVLTKKDRAEIQSWNSGHLQVHEATIHDMISRWASNAPDTAAVSAWDGDWTYAQLDSVSSRIATHIQFFDLGEGQAIIPLCFEKSKWVIATMLAVLKAGQAFALIDPKDPSARMTQICRQTMAQVALVSKLHSNTLGNIVGRCIVVDDDFLQSLPCDEGCFEAALRPKDLAYAIFTSGSTGEPKGIMIEHQGFVSCATKFGPEVGISNRTRALQFASYGFGACLVETVTTLIHGGCVCIPSDDDRINNVPDYIKRCKVNWAMVTPSYIGTFRPEDVSGLQTLVLGGEPISASIRDVWAARVQLLNVYGQSESSTICSLTTVSECSLEPNNIGRGVGARSWIIDPNDPNQLVPIGCVGELVIESPGIARDYIIAPSPGKSPFLHASPDWYPVMQLPGGFRFYRTGDLVRYSSDGSIVCLGRMDSQVKIRGQRVEISEVEACLRKQLPSHLMIVAEAIKRSNTSSKMTLIAFLIEPRESKGGRGLGTSADTQILDHSTAKEINAKLQQSLPSHSIPSHYICMKDLPRTATGKVDRRSLRRIASELLGDLARNVTSPSRLPLGSSASSTERKLRELWLMGLNLDPNSNNVGASFYELGGDSIAAIKMVNMARSVGIALRVSDILQNPTLAGLVSVIKEDSVSYSPIPGTKYDGPVEQSFAQGRLWFLDQVEVGASWYLLPYGTRVRGPLDIDALTIALLALEKRHEPLRTTFEELDGVGVQIVHASLFKELRVTDVSEDQDGGYLLPLQQEQTTPFNLSSEAGWRVSLMRLGKDDHILSIVIHHIIADGWSIDILRRELSQFYAAALQGREPLSTLSPLPTHYRNFSVWQKEEEQEAEHQRQLEYWTNQLVDSSPAEFLTDLPRPTVLSGKACAVPVIIDGELYEKLRNFCKAHQVTPFTALLVAFRAAHYRLTGADDAIIGTPIANRNRQELENMIGFFVNTQCMRITVDAEDTFDSLVQQARSTVTAAFEHQDVPFERIVSAMASGSRDLSRNPLTQLIFALHSQSDLGEFELQGLDAEAVLNEVYTRFDVEFHLFQQKESITGNMVFAADLFKLENIRNVVSVFLQVLRQGFDQPQTPVAVLPLIDGLAELRNMDLLDIVRVKYPRDSSVVDLFRTQVAAHPNHPAVVDSSTRLTYADLDDQSDQLMNWLRQRNMAPETLVGVLAPRSCQTVVAFLGILKANCAFLPLDINCPAARLKAILSAFPGEKLVLLGSDTTFPEIEMSDVELVRIDDTFQPNGVHDSKCHAKTSLSLPSATSLAYVIFTSGSTGKPKGVMVEHRSLIRLVKESDVVSELPPAVKMAHLFNIASDPAVLENFAALLNGGTVVCIDYMSSLDSKALETIFVQERVNAAVMAPALLKQCLESNPNALGRLDFLIIGGDRLDSQDAILAQKLVRSCVFNAYGPTENGVVSTIYKVAENDSFINGVPIGRAISNSGAYIMDLNQQLVPAGVMGELVVTGDGLARGYTDPMLNAERFVYIDIGGQVTRAYRTGDRVRYRVQDGQIEFFGRMDQQVKIRNHRVEPAEVERAILRQSSVHDAVVVVRDQQGLEPEMVGFVVTQDDHSAEQDEEAGNQVKGWQGFFEGNTYADIENISQSDVGNDFKGWTSMYDGSEINKDEMREWLEDTIRTLLDGQAPGHVLEIGTGSGMVLFNLGEGLESYVGLEPSKSAAAFVTRAIQSIPALAAKAEVHVGTATDVSRLAGLCPNLVVLNSVVQYFPSPQYLVQVVNTLVRIPGVRRLFFGDIRSHATNKHFLAARALHVLGSEPTRASVRQKMAEFEEREEELLVDPTFFTALKSQFPDHVTHVEILPKNMEATNELSAYRYAAVVHVRGAEELEQHVHPINKEDCIDFQGSHLDRQALLDLLKRSADAPAVAVSNIPYSKTIFERHVFDSLETHDKDDTQDLLDGAAWVSAVRSESERCASLSVVDLTQLGREAGFHVEVSAARQWSQSGALDVVFHNYPSRRIGGRVLIQFPTDDQARRSAALTNRPLQRLRNSRFCSLIREQLQALLPSYMIPSRILVIDKMPLNASNKIDRKELTRRAMIVPKSQVASQQVFPLNEIEVILCEEFTDVLGMDVSTNDDFFKLGGHSLMATKLASRVSRRLKTRVSIKDVFDHPVIADLAALIREGLTLHNSTLTTYSRDGKQGISGGVAPRNAIEAVLCQEFSDLLGVPAGITDNFFHLGGHSLMASKLAARLGRRLEAFVSVKDVFDHPILAQLANKIGCAQSGSYEVAGGIQLVDIAPFELLHVKDPQEFIQKEFSSQLNYSHDTILDAYPPTQLQRHFLTNPTTGKPFSLIPLYIDLPPDTDCACLTRACTSLVEHFDIFRMVFLRVAGELYQVVLKHLDVPIETIETEENVNSKTRAFLDEDLAKPICPGQPLIRMTILKTRASPVRVLLRLSHALYDGLSLEQIVRALHLLYSGTSLPTPPKFSQYMHHMANSRKDGYEFWCSTLHNSSVTRVGCTNDTACKPQAALEGTHHATKIISVPLQATADSRITQATVFTVACALVLSHEAGTDDVVFGRLVSGRQGLPLAIQDTVGPCANIVPVRVRLDRDASRSKLLRETQDQHLSSLPFDTLGFDEIKKNCTDWPEATTNFGCCVVYQNINYHPVSEIDEKQVQIGALSRDNGVEAGAASHELVIAGEVEADGPYLHVTIAANPEVCGEERMKHMLEEVCEKIQALSGNQ